MNTKGKFIVFEGTDGSGKSTQIKLLEEYLSCKGVSCVRTSEPTHSPFGALLRDCLTGRLDTDEHAIAALFAADRLDHVLNSSDGMLKTIESGVTVLCDRYYISSLAYNGGFVSTDWVFELNSQAMRLLRPDLTIYLDVDPEEAISRVEKRGEPERYETLARQKLIRDKYFQIFDRLKDEENIAIVKSEGGVAETQEKVRSLVRALFEKE